MKKILFAALAALAITSCSQNEIDGIDNGTPKSKNEIGVNTIVKKSSRAAVTSNSSFTSFKLHAYIVKSNDIAGTCDRAADYCVVGSVLQQNAMTRIGQTG